MIENLAVGAVCEGVIPRDDAPGQRDVQMSGLGMKQMRAAAVSGGASLYEGASLFTVLEHLAVGIQVRRSVVMSTYLGSQPSCLSITRSTCLLVRNQPSLTG